MNLRQKIRIQFVLVIALALVAGVIAYPRAVKEFSPLYDALQKLKINLGLDLQGGIHLEYRADTAGIESDKIGEAVQAVQDVVERRVNAFGVGESVVQTSESGGEQRIIVELPGVKDIEEAKKKIKDTPKLDFREETDSNPEGEEIIAGLNEQTLKRAQETLIKITTGGNFEELAKENSQDPDSRDKGGNLDFIKKGTLLAQLPEVENVIFDPNFQNETVHPNLVESPVGWHIIKKIEERGEGDEREVRAAHIFFAKMTLDMIPEFKYKETGLSGKNLENVEIVFQDQGLSEPQVSIQFDEEGTRLFAEITTRNVGKPLAIFLDGELKDKPVIQQPLTDGKAVITGNFSVEEANRLKNMINEGALPLPLELVSQYSIEASLGQESLRKSLFAGVVGVAAVMVFMVAYYRFLGLIASLSLLIYASLMVMLFKLSGTFTQWPITLSLAGIAGFILSLGMAVDANVLIFERTKEELKSGKNVSRAIAEGFRRAWPSIRDGNYSTILTALILIWMGTSFVKGFAIILTIGIIASMFTAIVMVRIILAFIAGEWLERRPWLIGHL